MVYSVYQVFHGTLTSSCNTFLTLCFYFWNPDTSTNWMTKKKKGRQAEHGGSVEVDPCPYKYNHALMKT